MSTPAAAKPRQVVVLRVSAQGRVHIPRTVLAHLGIAEGSQIVMFVHPVKPLAMIAAVKDSFKEPSVWSDP